MTAFQDGQTFYLKAPGCDQKASDIETEAALIAAFSTQKELFDIYKGILNENAQCELYNYYKDYKRGILDSLEKHQDLIPKKWIKLLNKLIQKNND